jgi:hypothetical protein
MCREVFSKSLVISVTSPLVFTTVWTISRNRPLPGISRCGRRSPCRILGSKLLVSRVKALRRERQIEVDSSDRARGIQNRADHIVDLAGIRRRLQKTSASSAAALSTAAITVEIGTAILRQRRGNAAHHRSGHGDHIRIGDGTKPAALHFHDVVIGHIVDIGASGLKASHNLIRASPINPRARSDCLPSQP